jgi:hypothetical protein
MLNIQLKKTTLLKDRPNAHAGSPQGTAKCTTKYGHGHTFLNSIEEKESKWGCVFNPAPKGGQTAITVEK